MRPASRAARVLRRVSSGVSPKRWRRSLWPTSARRGAGLGGHRGGDLPGEGALGLPVEVLDAQEDVGARGGGRARRGEGDAGGKKATLRSGRGDHRARKRAKKSRAPVGPEVHLPVAGDDRRGQAHSGPPAVGERRDARQGPALEELERGAAAGGDVRDPVGEAELADGRGGVAAADHRGGAGRGGARRARGRRRRCPARNSGISKTPIGPFQSDGARVAEDLGVGGHGGRTRRRAPSSPRGWRRGRRRASGAPAAMRCATTTSWGSTSLSPARAEQLARQRHAVLLHQRGAGLQPLRAEEGVGHRPADEQAVDLGEQRLDDVDLPGDLGPAEDGDEGALGVVEGAAEVLQLALHQQAGHGEAAAAADHLRYAGGGGVGAVGGAEGVVDVEVPEGGHPRAPAPGRPSPRRGGSGCSPGRGRRRRRARAWPARPAGRRSRRRSPPSAARSSASRCAAGRSDISGTRLPLGRPRCDSSTRRAPMPESFSSVGSVARMRVSSVTSCRSSSGTL